jgi:phosphoglycerate kinase
MAALPDGIKHVEDIATAGKRVFVRVDFNVPLDKTTKKITDDARITATLPTIKHLIERGARIVLGSHLGRPDGQVKPELSLEPVAARLAELLGVDVVLADEVVGDGARKVVNDLRDGQIALLENLRFHPEEEANDEQLSRTLASYWTSTSTMRSAPRTARTPRPPAWRSSSRSAAPAS